jgi:hypothetical protein
VDVGVLGWMFGCLLVCWDGCWCVGMDVWVNVWVTKAKKVIITAKKVYSFLFLSLHT